MFASGADGAAVSEADNRLRLAECVRQLQEAEASIESAVDSASAAQALLAIQAQVEELEAEMNAEHFEEIDLHEVVAARDDEEAAESHIKHVEEEADSHIKEEKADNDI